MKRVPIKPSKETSTQLLTMTVAIVIGLLVLPNIFLLIKMHPYQYVYYNVFTDGVGGAFRIYEMDYWGTSYREAAEYINQIAPQNARVIVFGAPHLVETHARDDLQVEKYKKDMAAQVSRKARKVEKQL